jgi:glucose-6-phosphate 1-dehydrogenase
VTSVKLQTRTQEQFCLEVRPDPCGLVIFGASGDLAERKLFPALFRLRREGHLPQNFYVVGVGRTPMTDDAFRARVEASLKAAAPTADADAVRDFAKAFHYHTGAYDDAKAYAALSGRLTLLDAQFKTGCNRLFYLSIPPTLYVPVVRNLGAAGLDRECTDGLGWTRIIIEKPFGVDLETARQLNKEVGAVFNEEQTYRIDHYLGKETVQSILVFRFANVLFEPVWNRTYVDHVQITAAEEIGIGHRAGYYDEAGVLRDMFQNHLLQLLCITAMEAPSSFAADRVRDEKSKVLRSIRSFSAGDIERHAVRGQYGPGSVDGSSLLGYRQEKGVPADSRTETFAALKLYVDNWRWQGVPFYLRSGKRMPRRVTEIAVHFKHVPHLLFEPLKPTDILPNVLVMRIQPEEGISMSFETKHPGPKLCMSAVTMDFNYETSFGEPPEAYERLFLDAMSGDQTLFTRADWVDLSWGLLAPLFERWKTASAPAFYPSGSWGPAESDALLAAAGHTWRNQ